MNDLRLDFTGTTGVKGYSILQSRLETIFEGRARQPQGIACNQAKNGKGYGNRSRDHYGFPSGGVREKLRLVSTRNATVKEDIAYSLIGIFSSDIMPGYGLRKTTLGHLLENIVARTGDVTVIVWTGKSLSYNYTLPASLAVYSQVPYSPPPKEVNELDTCVEQLRTQLAPQDTLAFHYRIVQLPRATFSFSNRSLQLPCILFSIAKTGVQELNRSLGNLYRTKVSIFGNVEFRTADAMPLKQPRRLVFIHPWLRDLLMDLHRMTSARLILTWSRVTRRRQRSMWAQATALMMPLSQPPRYTPSLQLGGPLYTGVAADPPQWEVGQFM